MQVCICVSKLFLNVFYKTEIILWFFTCFFFFSVMLYNVHVYTLVLVITCKTKVTI